MINLQDSAAFIISRCLLVASKITALNKESVFASMLGHWFIRCKHMWIREPNVLEFET